MNYEMVTDKLNLIFLKDHHEKTSNKTRKIIHLLILFTLTVNSFLIAGCLTDSNDKDDIIDNDLIIGTSKNVSGFYPWMNSRDITTLSVNRNLFTCLVEIDSITERIVPGLAESWNNPNNVTWRFFLRKGVKFHNGDLFTADDVKFTIEYMRNYPFHSQELESISDVITVDNYTIDINTKKPVPLLLYKLATLFILSDDYMRTIENTNESWPIGTGAYQLVDYIPGDHIILQRFENYWKGQPDVHNVTFKKMNSSEELKNALIQGELDLIQLSSEDVEEIENTIGLTVKSVQSTGVAYLSFDFRVNDSYGFQEAKNPVSDERVRKAVYHAINIDTIIKKCYNQTANPASQFLTDYTFGYNPAINRLPYNLEIAKELMREAGYEAGFTIQLDTQNAGKWLCVSTEIANQLAAINITVILNPQPPNEYYTTLYYKNTSFYIAAIIPLEAEGLIKLLLQTSNMVEGDGVWNYGNYSNPEVDRLCELLSYTMDTWKRREYFYEIFSLAASDIAWIPLFSMKNFYGVIDNIDWKPSPSSYIIVEEISFKN